MRLFKSQYKFPEGWSLEHKLDDLKQRMNGLECILEDNAKLMPMLVDNLMRKHFHELASHVLDELKRRKELDGLVVYLKKPSKKKGRR